MVKRLEKVLDDKIKPIIDTAMLEHIGINISEIGGDISDKLRNNPLIGIPVKYELPFRQAKKEFKKQFMERLLKTHHGNISEVARILGMDRRSVHRIVEKESTQAIRDELPKPYYLKQKEVEGIIESVMSTYKPITKEDKLENIYNNVEEISKDIVDQLPDEEMSWKEAEIEFEKKYIEFALKHKKSFKQVAKLIGISYETLLRKMKKLNLKNSEQQ